MRQYGLDWAKKNSVVVGGVYHEHQHLGGDNTATWQEKLLEQERCWDKFLSRWSNIGRTYKCFVVGDMNLDYQKWESPEAHHLKMVNATKDTVEILGFQQLIAGITRQWKNQDDSTLDHVWTNVKNRSLRHLNVTNGALDHNVIGTDISTCDIKFGGQNIVKQIWKNFNRKRCLEKFANMDWSGVMSETNVDLANTEFEDKFCHILDTEAPFRNVQVRANFNPWLTQETKNEMRYSNLAREKAKVTDDFDDWNDYKIRRNDCTKRQINDKMKRQKEIFDKIETEKDSSELFKMTRNLLNIKTGRPPSCLQTDGNTSKQAEVAEIQIDYYMKKI